MAVFGQKWANFEFSTKKRNSHFFTFMEQRVHGKNQKNLMRGFQNKNKNTDFGLFWPKMANFGPFLSKKGPILNFWPKSETVIFYSYGATGS